MPGRMEHVKCMLLICEYPTYRYQYTTGAPNKGGFGGIATPPEFWMGGLNTVNPPDFEKIFIRGGWLPLNRSNYIVYVFLST